LLYLLLISDCYLAKLLYGKPALIVVEWNPLSQYLVSLPLLLLLPLKLLPLLAPTYYIGKVEAKAHPEGWLFRFLLVFIPTIALIFAFVVGFQTGLLFACHRFLEGW